MYKFTPEQKKDAKELIRRLHDKHYLNTIKVVIQQRQEGEETRQKSVPTAEGFTVGQVPAVSYTDVKNFVVAQPWAEKSTRDLATSYTQIHPEAPLAKIKQYIQRVTWELRKKNAAPSLHTQ